MRPRPVPSTSNTPACLLSASARGGEQAGQGAAVSTARVTLGETAWRMLDADGVQAWPCSETQPPFPQPSTRRPHGRSTDTPRVPIRVNDDNDPATRFNKPVRQFLSAFDACDADARVVTGPEPALQDNAVTASATIPSPAAGNSSRTGNNATWARHSGPLIGRFASVERCWLRRLWLAFWQAGDPEPMAHGSAAGPARLHQYEEAILRTAWATRGGQPEALPA